LYAKNYIVYQYIKIDAKNKLEVNNEL